MPNPQRIETPEGTFHVFHAHVGSVHSAQVVYYLRLPLEPDAEQGTTRIEIKTHTEVGSSSDEAFEELLGWCIDTFGIPCIFTQ
jgi:hypothetical protein